MRSACVRATDKNGVPIVQGKAGPATKASHQGTAGSGFAERDGNDGKRPARDLYSSLLRKKVLRNSMLLLDTDTDTDNPGPLRRQQRKLLRKLGKALRDVT